MQIHEFQTSYSPTSVKLPRKHVFNTQVAVLVQEFSIITLEAPKTLLPFDDLQGGLDSN